MSKNKFLFYIKALILLSPLPFGCSGRVWLPLFYLILLVISATTLWPIRDRVSFLFKKPIRTLFLLFLGFLVFQLIPLPAFLLKIISPETLNLLSVMAVEPVRFHSLALVPFHSLMFLVQILVMALFFVTVLNLKLERRDIYSLGNVMLLSASIQVVLGLAKYFFKSERFFLFFHQMESSTRLASGTFRYSVHFYMYLEMLLPLLIGLFLIQVYFVEHWESVRKTLWLMIFKKRILLFYLILFPLLAAGIWYSKSLTGRMSMFLTILFMAMGFIYFRMRSSSGSFQGLRWVLLTITLVSILFSLQNTMTGINRPDRSGKIRAVVWKDAGKIFSGFPVTGVGYGNFQNVSYLGQARKDEIPVSHVDNDYLEMLAEGGIVGAGLFLTVLGLLMASLLKMWLPRQHPQVKIMGLALMVSLFIAFFHAFFDSALRIPSISFLLVLIMALSFKMILYKREVWNEA